MTDLNDFFKSIAIAKAKDPKEQAVKQVKEKIQGDLSSLFEQLSNIANSNKSLGTKVNSQQIEIIEEKVITEVSTTRVEEPKSPKERADSVEKYLNAIPKDSHTFQQPIIEPVPQEFKAIQDKMKFLEQWMAKISAVGPGGGEVNFRWLDDVNRSTMTSSNGNWVLEYDKDSKGVQFTDSIGPICDVNSSTLEVTSKATCNALDVNDNIITIAKDLTEELSNGSGLVVDGSNASLIYHYPENTWNTNRSFTPLIDDALNLGDASHKWSNVYAQNTNTREVSFDISGPQNALIPGQIAWNADEDCLDIKHSDGTTLQTGLEQYIRVHNHTAETMANGTVVQFAGVENTNAVAMPIISKYVADSNASPLFLIGVLTSDIPTNGIGRATVFGYVRNLNTTGSDVGETWVQGDILWAHPTQPGKMTRVRPSAPNVATSVAAVVRVDAIDGQILVRPTIWPRLYYGDWYDTTNQTATLANTAYAVKMNSIGAVSGFEISTDKTTVKALNAGRYNFEFSLQFTSANSSASRIYIWYRKNGVDVQHSATVVTISSNGGKLAPAWNFPVLMQANDTFTLMWATDSTSVSLSAEPSTGFCPSIPSVILTVSQSNL